MQQISLSMKDFEKRSSTEHNWGKRDADVQTSSGCGHNEFASLSQDVDHALFSVLQVCSYTTISCGSELWVSSITSTFGLCFNILHILKLSGV